MNLQNGSSGEITRKINDQAESESDNSGMIVVGIGSSAGGVEALEAMFSVMPDKLGMAFIVVQHLSPDFESLMPQILARKTVMTVQAIEDEQVLEPNNVYVLPSGKDLVISDRTLFTRDQDEKRSLNKPIDQFFFSLANDVGESAVGIVLSGTGNDGSRGIREIHDAGGLVVVQSEKSAKFNGMPRSAINTGIVDSIATIDEIPNSLIRFSELGNGDSKRSRLDQFAEGMETENRILHLLHVHFGIDFEQYKNDMFGRRVERRICLTKETSSENYLQRLESDPQELKQLYSDLLIGVTEFFRDREAFDELQLRVLPPLLDAAAPSGEFRVWVAPCASGEEAYSIAIIIDEMLSNRDFDLDVKIFATDVNGDCIDFASRGIYPEECLGNVSPQRIEKYFKHVDEGFMVSRDLRKQIVFATHNVMQDAPFTKLNMVSCRNLLIYLKAEAKRKILSLFNFSLHKNGVLFLGPSESLAELAHEFRTISDRWRIFRKIAPVRMSSVNLPNNLPIKTRKRASEDRVRMPHSELMNVYDSLLGEFMPPGLLIDDAHQIVHIFGAATKYLEFKPGRPTSDFLELLPPTFRIAVSNGLKRLRIDSKPVVYPGLKHENEEGTASVRVTIKPADAALTLKFLVIFEDESQLLGMQSSSNSDIVPIDGGLASIERIQFLEEQLQSTRESLHDSILDLKSANEEMQSTNEELIASNEELQSTNEELHSVNEELYTVNSEHQRKITELTEMTDDMENLLDSIQVDTIFLDRELKVRKFTLGIAQTFRLIPQDLGRHIDSFNHELQHPDIVGLVEKVLENETTLEEEVQDTDQNWYLMRLLPYNSRGKIDGVLLTLIDITKIKETEQRLAELSEIVESSDDAIFRITPDGIIRTWNRGSQQLFSHTANYIIGKSVSVLTLYEEGQNALENALETIGNGERIDHIQMKAVRRSGEEVDVQMSVSPIYGADNEVVAASIVLRDFTKEKQAEEINLDAVRRRDQFLAMLSHELRNPIAAIMNSLAVLRGKAVTAEKDASARSVILGQSKQLAKLLDDLLDVSRITHDKIKLDMKPVDIVQLSNQVIECVENRLEEKSQSLTLEMPNEPVFILADVTRIIQAQVNLLVNATKYTPACGSIKYSISAVDGNAIIEVEDDGEGMSEELMQKVFEVFVQADQPLDRNVGGMGLGLPLVRMIATAHSGQVSAVSSGVGKGSKFTLSFPMTQAGEFKKIKTICPPLESLSCRKLMLVEDNAGAREMLAEFLSVEGCDVVTAADGLEAISVFEEFEPTICVVDIGLPDLNGFEVISRIQKMKHQPQLTIALTGYGQEKDRQEILEAGFDIHIVKPVDPDELVRTIAIKLNNNSVDIMLESE
ncbi:MAG: chemotaxis protein CheB [Mariniblastus sp.]